jgi:hypothetical protein
VGAAKGCGEEVEDCAQWLFGLEGGAYKPKREEEENKIKYKYKGRP